VRYDPRPLKQPMVCIKVTKAVFSVRHSLKLKIPMITENRVKSIVKVDTQRSRNIDCKPPTYDISMIISRKCVGNTGSKLTVRFEILSFLFLPFFLYYVHNPNEYVLFFGLTL
jgi:hypothetical protein